MPSPQLRDRRSDALQVPEGRRLGDGSNSQSNRWGDGLVAGWRRGRGRGTSERRSKPARRRIIDPMPFSFVVPQPRPLSLPLADHPPHHVDHLVSASTPSSLALSSFLFLSLPLAFSPFRRNHGCSGILSLDLAEVPQDHIHRPHCSHRVGRWQRGARRPLRP